MNKIARWYDKYSDLKSILHFLENMDDYSIELIAQDFIQIIISKYKDKFDSVIDNMSKNAPPKYKRWYDNNYNLHTCIEFIKTLDTDEERNDVIHSFVIALVGFMKSADNE